MKRILFAAALVLAAACGTEEPADQAVRPAETIGTTAPAPPKVSGSSECADPARDVRGAQPGLDLTKVILRSDGAVLTVTYELSGALPAAPADGASWVVTVQGDGGGIYQLGLKLVGREVFRFVADLGASRQENLPPTYTAENGRLVVAFPLSSLRAIGVGFSWKAATTFAGADVDRCPESGQVRFGA